MLNRNVTMRVNESCRPRRFDSSLNVNVFDFACSFNKLIPHRHGGKFLPYELLKCTLQTRLLRSGFRFMICIDRNKKHSVSTP